MPPDPEPRHSDTLFPVDYRTQRRIYNLTRPETSLGLTGLTV